MTYRDESKPESEWVCKKCKQTFFCRKSNPKRVTGVYSFDMWFDIEECEVWGSWALGNFYGGTISGSSPSYDRTIRLYKTPSETYIESWIDRSEKENYVVLGRRDALRWFAFNRIDKIPLDLIQYMKENGV